MSDDKEIDKYPIVCPKCGEPIGVNLVTKIMDQHRYAFAFKPGTGLFSTKTIGGLITQIGNLGNSLAEDIGVKTQTLVERIATDDDGTITVHLLTTIIANPALPSGG